MGKSRCTRTVVRKISTKELMEDTLRPNANWQPVYQGTPTQMLLKNMTVNETLNE